LQLLLPCCCLTAAAAPAAAAASGLTSSKPSSQQDLSGRQPDSEIRPALAPDQDMSKFPQHINPRAEPGSGQAPAGASGFMGMGGVPGRRGANMSPEGMAHAVMRQGQQGQQTAEKVRRGAKGRRGGAG
jgi:hypothetical protein